MFGWTGLIVSLAVLVWATWLFFYARRRKAKNDKFWTETYPEKAEEARKLVKEERRHQAEDDAKRERAGLPPLGSALDIPDPDRIPEIHVFQLALKRHILVHRNGRDSLKPCARKTYNCIFADGHPADKSLNAHLDPVNQIFDRKVGELTVHYSYWLKPKGKNPYETQKFQKMSPDQKGGHISFTVRKHVALLQPAEREALRVAWTLYTLSKLDDQTFLNCVMVILWSNGDCFLSDCMTAYNINSKEEDDFALPFEILSAPETLQHDRKGFVQFFINNKLALSAQGVISDLMNTVEKLYRDKDKLKDWEAKTIEELYSRVHGGNEWLNTSDIENSIYKDVKSPYRLLLGLHEERKDFLRYSGDEALITIAPPGAGKSQCQVIPNLITWPGSAIVLDIKGELYEQTAGHRQKDYGEVIKFDVFDPDTAAFNPFDFLSDNYDELWNDAGFLANMMIVQTDSSQPFWELSARKIVQCVLCAMVLNKEARTLRFVLRALSNREVLKECAYELETSGNDDLEDLGAEITGMINSEGNGSNVLITVLQQATLSLNGLRGEQIKRCTAQSDWKPLDFREKSKTLYIVLRPGKVIEYLPLLRMVVGIHLEQLRRQIPDKDSRPVLFMLDEMPQLRNMPPIIETLETGRQYKLRLWMFAQSKGQLDQAYGDADSIISQCAIKCYMNPSGAEGDNLAEDLSQALGTREGFVDGRQSRLVEAFELTGPEYADKIITLGRGAKPAVLKKVMAYQHKMFADKMGMPVEKAEVT